MHEWLHVVGVFDPGSVDDPGAGVLIYKNGQLRGSPTASKGALYSTYNIRPSKERPRCAWERATWVPS